MFLVNLTLAQFLAIFGSVSVGVLALYLWDRSRRRLTVPTLRFWTASVRAAEVKHRRRIQQPWSLLLQLLGIALLLLAAGQLRFGSAARSARDHVVLLDTSAWMAARSKGHTLMDEARAIARAYIYRLPSSDRVMLVRADALATPATAFETNRKALEDAIDASRPGATALNLDQAFEFARQIRRIHGGRSGETVYIGYGHAAQQPPLAKGADLRILPVEASVANCGLRNIALRRSAADPDVWEIMVAVQNYGAAPRPVTVTLAFGESLAGARRLLVPARKSETATFQYRSRAAGWLEVRVAPEDDFEGNHRAILEVPARRTLKLLAYTDEPELLKPAFAGSPEVEATFLSPAMYDPGAQADIVVLDRFSPPAPPRCGSIWIEPPGASPIGVRDTVSSVALTRWRTDHALGAGLRTRDVRLQSAQLLDAAPGDIVIAETDRGPVAVAREGDRKSVVLGFHPMRTGMRFELATPLLFANILRWMQPDSFRRWELNAGSAGMVNAEVEDEREPVQVLNEAGRALPHTRQGRIVKFFVGSPGIVRVAAGNSTTLYSLVLPELADAAWTPPADVRRGLPRQAALAPSFVELWPWLAAAGLIVLLIEWIVYGRARRSGIRYSPPAWRSAAAGTRGPA